MTKGISFARCAEISSTLLLVLGLKATGLDSQRPWGLSKPTISGEGAVYQLDDRERTFSESNNKSCRELNRDFISYVRALVLDEPLLMLLPVLFIAAPKAFPKKLWEPLKAEKDVI